MKSRKNDVRVYREGGDIVGNVFRVLKRDLVRLLKAPSALIVMLALLVLPSAYTWYNVVAFWSPYDNTGNMQVSVVNEDQGTTSDLIGSLNVGDMIVDELAENTQLGWKFEDYDSAMDHLNSGESYAVFVIPEGFSGNIMSITSGNFTKPTINYYVNEKKGPVSPKITDSGRTVLEETVNSTFIKTVSEVVVNVVDEALVDVNSSTDEVKNTSVAKLSSAIEGLQEARNSLSEVDAKLALLQATKGTALSAINTIDHGMGTISSSLTKVSEISDTMSKTIDGTAPGVYSAVSEALALLSELIPYAEEAGCGQEVRDAISNLETYNQLLFAQMLPTTSRGLSGLSSSTASLSVVVTSNSTILNQSRTFIDQLDMVVNDARNSLQSTDVLLGDVQDDLSTLKNDLSLFTIASITDVLGVDGDTFNASTIASFVSQPTTIKTEKMFELTSYGAAMAPLFMNLTFWIGAFMFLVVFKNVADDEGFEKLTLKQRYLSRFLYFCVPAMLQGAICCVGLIFLGVSVANLPALIIASMVCSIAYLSIIYALSLMFMHIGKGLCVVLVFLQIPSATGLYPIEMTEPFYQALCPFFPFTYGIGAVREALCGFYGYDYFKYLAVLVVFFVLFLALGLICQPLLASVNRMAAREISLSGLLNGDRVELPARSFKAAEVLKRLANSEEYGRALNARFETFSRCYPRMVYTASALLVAIPLVTGIISSVLQLDCAVTLTIWLCVFAVSMVFFTALETIKNNYAAMFVMSEMDDGELARVAVEQNAVKVTEDSETLISENTPNFWKFDTKAEYDAWHEANAARKERNGVIEATSTDTQAPLSEAPASTTDTQASSEGESGGKHA